MIKHCSKYIVTVGMISCSCLLASCDKPQESSGNTMNKPTQETTKQGRQTLPSGLSYEVMTPTTDPHAKKPTRGQKVTVHYTGWLQNSDGSKGKKFDSSVDRGQKFSFTIGVGQVIKGWDEGVMDMSTGEKRLLIIPADLGYGSRGAGNAIPGGATLLFEVELFEVA
jgi:FKBP-type peptidyl-prolyl cis-trans isomerase